MLNTEQYIKTLPSDYEMAQWEANTSFFSRAEMDFFCKLCKYIKGKKVTISSKVRIADLVHPKHKLNNSDYYRIFGRTNRKHVDYVILDYTGKILCLIELDGESHEKISTQKSDIFKDIFFKRAGLNLERFKNHEKYDFHRLDNYITG
jgi:hypothetical protein